MADLDFALVCAVCGKSLKGSSLEGVCAYCGAAVGATVNREVVDPTRLTVSIDVSCVRCGYNLFTMPIGAYCPECGEHVVLSLRPDDLRFADLEWLRRVHAGIIALLWWMIGTPLALAAIIALGSLPGSLPDVFGLLAGLALLILLSAGIGGIVGIGNRDRSLLRPPGGQWPHTLASALPILSLLALGFCVISVVVAPNLPWFVVFSGICLLAAFLCAMLSVISAVVCMRRIAERGRRPALADTCKTLMWCLIIAGVCWPLAAPVHVLMNQAFQLGGLLTMSRLELLAALSMVAALLVTTISYVLGMIVLVGLRALVKGAMEERGVAHADGRSIDQFEADGAGDPDDLIDGRS
jgi:DNA-directed RNA polymerase subunit RPC12/RpoP